MFIRLRWIGLGAGVGGLLTASLLVTGVLIGYYNTDVLEAEQIETGLVLLVELCKFLLCLYVPVSFSIF